MHSIRTALSNFEDMRINAKELAILKDAKRTTLNAEKDQVRLDLIPSVSGWVWLGVGWSLPLLRAPSLRPGMLSWSNAQRQEKIDPARLVVRGHVSDGLESGEHVRHGAGCACAQLGLERRKDVLGG